MNPGRLVVSENESLTTDTEYHTPITILTRNHSDVISNRQENIVNKPTQNTRYYSRSESHEASGHTDLILNKQGGSVENLGRNRRLRGSIKGRDYTVDQQKISVTNVVEDEVGCATSSREKGRSHINNFDSRIGEPEFMLRPVEWSRHRVSDRGPIMFDRKEGEVNQTKDLPMSGSNKARNNSRIGNDGEVDNMKRRKSCFAKENGLTSRGNEPLKGRLLKEIDKMVKIVESLQEKREMSIAIKRENKIEKIASLVTDGSELIYEGDYQGDCGESTGKLVLIEAKEGASDASFLCDSGSQISCVNLEYVKSLEKINNCKYDRIPTEKVSIISATGVVKRNINKKVILPFTIKGKEFYHGFYLVESLNLLVILGGDFLRQYKVVIDYDSNTVNIGEIYVHFSEPDGSVALCNIRLTQDEFVDKIQEAVAGG